MASRGARVTAGACISLPRTVTWLYHPWSGHWTTKKNDLCHPEREQKQRKKEKERRPKMFYSLPSPPLFTALRHWSLSILNLSLSSVPQLPSLVLSTSGEFFYYTFLTFFTLALNILVTRRHCSLFFSIYICLFPISMNILYFKFVITVYKNPVFLIF